MTTPTKAPIWVEVSVDHDVRIAINASRHERLAARPLGMDRVTLLQFAQAVKTAASVGLPLKSDVVAKARAIQKAVLDGAVGEVFARLRESADGPLLVRFNVHEALQAVPWEALCNPGEALGFWGASPDTFPVRGVSTGEPWQPRNVDGAVRVLVIAPTGTGGLTNLRQALDEHIDKGNVEWLEPILGIEAKLPTLFDRLHREPAPHILHFLGHGGIRNGLPALRLADDINGDETWLPVELLAQQLRTRFRQTLRVVVLEACAGAQPTEFASAAEILARDGADAVVAHLWPIRAESALTCSTQFYRVLAGTGDLVLALNEARRVMLAKHEASAEAFAPVAYLRAPTGKLFDFERRIVEVEPSMGEPLIAREGAPHDFLEEERIFVGRQEELARLEQALVRAKELLPVAICAVQGMAGVGKSYLADKFARDHAAVFPGGTIRLVLGYDDRRSAQALADGWLGTLADKLHVRGSRETHAADVRNALLAGRALLHVENIDTKDAAGAAEVLAKWLRGCAVIVTGRYQALGHGPGWVKIPIDVFDKPEALELLDKDVGLSKDAVDQRARERLVEALGRLPLALRLAAGYLRVGGFQAQSFLEALHAQGLDVDPSDSTGFEHESDPARRNVHQTFALALQMFEAQVGAANAAHLSLGLRALGVAPGAGVGRSLGAAMAGLSDMDFARMLDAALRLSIIGKESRHGEDIFTMHPLLAWWMRRGVDEEAVTARMGAWFEERLPSAKRGPAWVEVGREIEALEEWLSRVQGDAAVRAVLAGLVYSNANGPYQIWMQVCERALAHAKEPTVRSDLLKVCADLAQRVGDLDRALRAAYEKEATDRARGDDRGVAIAMGRRAEILVRRGDIDVALRILREEVLPVYERLGNEPARAGCLSRIAQHLYNRGDYDEALRIRKENLLVYERRKEELQRATTLVGIADIWSKRGQFEEARRIYQEEALPVYERLGSTHSRIVTLGRIAEMLYQTKQYDEAIRIYEVDVLPVDERSGNVRGLLVRRGNLAQVLLARNRSGDRDKAARLLRQSLVEAERMRTRPDVDWIRTIQTKHGLS